MIQPVISAQGQDDSSPPVPDCRLSTDPTKTGTEAGEAFTIFPLQENLSILADEFNSTSSTGKELIDLLTQATVRIRVGRTCGSGTIVGRDEAGNAIVLTNAHVAGEIPGTTVRLERWDRNGNRYLGQATVIAGGYGRGMNIDFSLLRCEPDFANEVTPIPLIDRLPYRHATVVNFGCPRCEWPSLQVLRWNKTDTPILTWSPEAISGRSGSGVFEITPSGPRVVGLLTWGGSGEGLGQSAPFLLKVMRGKVPAAIQTLPEGVDEVGTYWPDDVSNETPNSPNLLERQNLTLDSQVPPEIIDGISQSEGNHGWFGRHRKPDGVKGPLRRGIDSIQQILAAAGLMIISGSVGYWIAKLTK